MFNFGVYKRQAKMSKTVNKIKKDYLDEREKRQQLKDTLTHNYRKRVENFVINMLQNPVAVTEYKGPQVHSLRDESSEKNICDPQLYVKSFKHEKDRIIYQKKKKKAQEQNSDLDFQPSQAKATYQFRERDINKEIQPEMRFRDKTSIERIQQFLKDHTQTQVENQGFQKNKKSLQLNTLSDVMSDTEKRAFIARSMAKNLLPSLHHKTHFQAATSMYNNLPVSLCEHTRSPTQQMISKIQEDQNDINNLKITKYNNSKRQILMFEELDQINENSTKLRADQMEQFNQIEASKQVLSTCNIIRQKNPKVKVIHIGEGHNISTLDRTSQEMYMDIYNIDLKSGNKQFRNNKQNN